MTHPRPKWTPKVANDNHPRKHTSPALNEARNSTLMKGRSAADKILRNEWAFDILIEIHDLLDAAAPHSSWLQHNDHGAADELGPDDTNSGFGMDVIHDYGRAEKTRSKSYGNTTTIYQRTKSKAVRKTASLGIWERLGNLKMFCLNHPTLP